MNIQNIYHKIAGSPALCAALVAVKPVAAGAAAFTAKPCSPFVKLPFRARPRRSGIFAASSLAKVAMGAMMLALATTGSRAQVSITSSGTAVTENFDGMGSTATAALPAGFKIGTDWASGTTAATKSAGTSGTGVLSSSSAGGVYNFANGVTATSTDRALGFLNSGSFTSPQSIVYAFTNNTGATITGLTIAFDYEKYRSGNRVWDWTFFHGSSSAPSTAETAGNQSYSSDGVNTTIYNPPTTTSKSFTITGLSIASGSTYYLKWTLTGNGGSSNGQGLGIDNFSLTASGGAAPTITGTATATAFTTTYGSASTAQVFSVSGANLTANLIATAPGGFEVSADGTTYGSTATFTQTSGSASGTLSLRLAATAAVTGSYNGLNVSLTSTGATTKNITTAASSNSVSAKGLTIIGVSANNRNYDGSIAATLSGTPAYAGLVNNESFSVTGTLAATFSDAAAAAGKTVTVTGYTAPSTNYTVTQPSLTANISPTPLTITANNVAKSFGATITGGPESTAFSSLGLVSPETVGSVTIAYGSGAAAGDASATYPASVIPSAATGGTFTASNYLISYVAGDLTVTATPTINLAGTLTAMATTYGTASPTPTSFSVTGTALPGDLSVNAPAGFEVSSGGGYSASLNLTQSGGSVSATISVRLAGETVVGTYSGNVSVSGGGAGAQSIAVPSSTVSPLGLTITGVSGVNKTYDRLMAATLSGTAVLNGVLTADVGNITLGGTPAASFATFTVGTSKPITVTGYSLSGSAAPNYTLAQPAGVMADITPLALTVSGAAVVSKPFDGNTNTTLTGTLNGVIAPDAVTLHGTGTFASSDAATNIPVTATCTLLGADAGNYSLIQPLGLTGTITPAAQTITFAALPGKKPTDAPFSLTASATSGLPVSFVSSDPTVATVSGNTVTLVGAGATTITASQAGSGNYSAAAPVNQELTVMVSGPVTIFHMNDTHARLTPHKWIIPAHGNTDGAFEDVGGAAFLAGKMLSLTSGNPSALVIDAGDISEGNPIGDMNGNGSMTGFYAMLSAKLKAQSGRGRGMDAVVVGNHDVRDASYIANLDTLNNDPSHPDQKVPVISMNVCAKGTKTPHFNAYTIVTVNGTKVGILGYTTQAAEVGASLAGTLDVVNCDWNSSNSTNIHIADYVKELRNNQGCDIVILAAHVGHTSIATDTARDGVAVPALLVDDGSVKLPEVAVTGHWHTWTDTVWQPEMLNYKTIFTESASYMKYIGELQVSPAGKYVSATQHVIRNATITPDADVASYVNNLKNTYNGNHSVAIDEVIGYTADDLLLDNKMKWWTADEYPWSGNNTAGQWICDAMQWKAASLFGGCDLALETGGGVRADIPAGPVTYCQIYETFPWNDDTFALINMTGQEIVDFLKKTNCDAGFSSKLDVTANDGIPTTVRFNGSAINLTQSYKVCINNYMYAHPPSGWTWKDTAPQYNGYLCREGIVDYMRQYNSRDNAYHVGGPRYHLNTEFAGGYRGVVTMVDDNDSKAAYETAYVRLLNATPETLARRGSAQVPADLVNADGSINQSNRLCSVELYRSFLGFKQGALKPGDLVEIWGKNSFYGGNPEFVDQEGISADGVEFNIVSHGNTTLAQPQQMASINSFMVDAEKNHYVSFTAKKTGDSTVQDQSGTTLTIWDATAYATKSLPGALNDQLVISGVPTSETKSGTTALLFRSDKAVLTADLPVSNVVAISPATQATSPLILTATASTPVVNPVNKTLGIIATEDAQVVKGKPTNNFGAATGLYVQSASTGSYQDERSWMKFNLASLPDGTAINAARLKMYCFSASTTTNMPVEVRGGAEDTWTEGTGDKNGAGDTLGGITWNTQPAFGGVLSSTTLASNTKNLWYSWDISSFVRTKYGANKLVSLLVKPETEGASTSVYYTFESKEWSSGRPTLEVDVPNTDPPVSIANVEFFYRYSADNSAWGAWTSVGTAAITAPYTTNFTYPNGDGYYEFYSVATDSQGTVEIPPATADASVRKLANQAPTVALTAPANGASFNAPANTTLTADAADSDGTVSKVEFFDGATKLDEDATAPYTYDWSNIPVGDHTLTAVATDNLGLSTVSAALVIHVVGNQAPTVALTAPASGASFITPANTTLTATAANSDGTVSKVEFFDGATKLGEDTTAPYTYDWSNISVGDHTLTAVATDNLGLSTTSAPVTITVGLPAVTIAATRASAGEYGTNRTLEFTISRSGSITNALVVPLVASGSATPGADYSGFASSVTIPAGSASATLTLTALPDNLVEGTETVTVSLGASSDFAVGASASANATIADAPISGAPWSFGVMADTQLTGYPTGGTNGVSTDIIDAVNQQFIAQGVDFVIQVGDLCEGGGASQLQTRLDHNAALTTAGIKFYGLRGNHEYMTGKDSSTIPANKEFFQSNFIPSGGNVEVAPFDSASYAVTWKGCKFVLLDYPTSLTTGEMDNATAWTNTVLGEIDHSQAFMFHHKNLLGQNHKDNQFGSGNESNPAQQNAFIAALQNNGVRYDMSGHDHMNHRSIVTSPDSLSKVQEIICQSDSTKFYIASNDFSDREQTISDQQLKIGYYTYTVDGPKVIGKYYTAEKDTPDTNQNGTIVASPVWTLQDTFGYSLNGKQTTVPRGSSYAAISDTTAKAVSNGEAGYLGTAMSILAGTNSTTGTAEGNRPEVDDVNTGWAPKSGALVSDVLSLWGMNNALGSTQTDTFTLSLSYDPATTSPMLATRSGSTWVNAVSGNIGGASKCVGDRAFNPATDTLGTYGYNSATHTAWAVINYNSDFAVASGTPTNIQITTIKGTSTYVQYSPSLAANTKVWLNFDSNPDNTPIRATQRFLGYREVDYKGLVSEQLALNAVTPTTVGGVTTYDYSNQSNKGTYLVGFWADKNLPIIIGPDGKAYITDGHHTTAGYLAANVASRYIIPGNEHVVIGTIVANYYDAAATTHPAPDDAWWQARQSENNTLLYGIDGNQLTRAADSGYAGLQPVLPSVQAMPLVPGKAGMADEALRSMAWGMADGIVKSATNSGGTRLTGYSKASTVNPGFDTNFVEFYWCDFLRNRIIWVDTKSGSALSTANTDRNLIQAPLGFYAAVANGIALAKSEVYRDQYGRSLADYNSDLSSTTTRNWAIDSTSSGRLAAATDKYNMYLLDDSGVQGDITPSLLSQANNALHIDTTTGQTIAGVIANFGKSVDINKGSSISTQWKDSVLNTTDYNSTLTIAPGTGTVTFTGANTYSGPTTIGAGTLALGANGSINSNSSITLAAGATLDTTAKSTYAIPARQFAIGLDGTGGGSSGRINASGLDISNASVSFSIANPLDDKVYVIGSYTSLTGTSFASVTVPAGYAINYAYLGNQIALVSSYEAWASANASGQAADQDNNQDGVPNGVKYFMGVTGSNRTATPGIVNRTITWPKSSLFLGTYAVEVSSDLVNWDPADKNYADLVKDYGSSVVFNLPSAPANLFVRLCVMPAP
jgi:autotransporter-associated beta strand protein